MIIALKNQDGTTDTFDTSTTINAQAKQHRSNHTTVALCKLSHNDLQPPRKRLQELLFEM
jgi:hypothetical protein